MIGGHLRTGRVVDLQEFVRGARVREIDLTTLGKCSGSHVNQELRDRANDLNWRLRWGCARLYVDLLLEFQSAINALDGGAHSSLPRAPLPGPDPHRATECDGAVAPTLLREHRQRHGYFLADELRCTDAEAWLATFSQRAEASRSETDAAEPTIRPAPGWAGDPPAGPWPEHWAETFRTGRRPHPAEVTPCLR